jgi:predicted nuclease of restriction endonuclease-like RecB superfamily
VLTADLVNARRRGAELHLVLLDEAGRARARTMAAALVDVVRAHVGRTREEIVAALAAIDVGAREQRTKAGLAKLVDDRCEFDADDGLEPEALRRDVFVRAAAMRSALAPGERFDRDVALAAIARERGATVDAVERALFADLRAAHVLRAFDAPSPEALVAEYERAQAQAVLLRAVKITVELRCASPGALRAFFRKLKFLRLLHSIATTERGHRIVIDGPFSLFESVTKYGLQLALVLPALEACDEWALEADVRWGKERTPVRFRLAGGAASQKSEEEEARLPDEVAALIKSFSALETAWKVRANEAILELAGIGLSIPDLVFERSGASDPPERIYLEVMGYWSRSAVWKRVELVQAGLAERILFAVSARLRVSEEVLEGDLPGALYVYKGTMSARAIADRLERLAARADALRLAD